jgi:glycosyltransferase involved in cell wall biosynthesis
MDPSSPKVVFLTAGGAGMYCGSCMRDNTLVRHLAARGWNIELVPAYTPIRTDEEDVSADRVFFGGINLYLLQTFPLLAHLPGWVFRWLDSPSLIRRATANASIPVDARQLGEMTLATLNGEHGLLRKEHARFVDWLVKESRPSLLNLTNLLIGGSIPLLRRRLPDVPILVTLQGDDLFLGQLTEPWKSAVIARMRELAAQADGFLTFSHAYADLMAALLEVPRDRFHLVPLGIDADPPAPRDTGTDRAPALGFFARLSPEKGFHHAVDAFLRLAQKPGMERTTFHFGGWLGARDRPFVEAQIQRLADGGLEGRFFHHGSPDRAGKSAFFRGIDLFSVPADFFEPKGLYVLEALAAGVPVIQPAHGAFPELLSACPAARLVPAHDPGALAEAWWEVLCSPDRGAAMGALGPAFIRDTASATRMAERTAEVYQQLIRSFLFRSR